MRKSLSILAALSLGMLMATGAFAAEKHRKKGQVEIPQNASCQQGCVRQMMDCSKPCTKAGSEPSQTCMNQCQSLANACIARCS